MTPEPSALVEKFYFGPYEILETLGKGGMGVVYRAHERTLGREVALKILRDDLRTEARVLARFRREAEAFARLDHPNIVHVFSVGVVEQIPFIAMQFIEGETLANRLRRLGPMPWRDALRIGFAVAEALRCAHAAQVIHRDIKPGNILLGDDDRVLVTDFGIAKVLNAATQLTIDGSRLGTPQYMCPERCRNEQVSPSSDLYSLGVVLFQSITGKLPYNAKSTLDLMDRIVRESPLRARDLNPELPESVDRLLAWMLEKSPTKRPANAGLLADAIGRVLAGKPLDANADERDQMLADYRKDMPTTRPRAKSPAIKPGRSIPLNERLSRGWFRLPSPVRMAAAALVCASALGALGYGAHQIQRRDLPRFERVGAADIMRRWESPPPLVNFTQEGDALRLASLSHPDLRVASMDTGDAPSTVRLMLAGGGVHAVLELHAAAGKAVSLQPPTRGEAMQALQPEMPGLPATAEVVATASKGQMQLAITTGAMNGQHELWFSEGGQTPRLLDEGDIRLGQHPFELVGRRVLYVNRGAVVLRNVDAGPDTVPHQWPGDAASWLPDGTTLAYAAPDALQRRQIYVRQVNRPLEARQLTHLETGVGALMASDKAGTILAAALPGGQQVVLIDLSQATRKE